MSVHKKLMKVRVALAETELKRSGEVKDKGGKVIYKHFELHDFLPSAMRLMMDNDLAAVFRYESDEATLTVLDLENREDKIVFTSPIAEATVHGGQAIQNLGAQHTYLRRYLWVMALELTEQDAVEGAQGAKAQGGKAQGEKPKTQSTSSDKPTQNQIAKIWATAKELDITADGLKAHLKEKYDVESSKSMSKKQASEVIEYLENLKADRKIADDKDK